MKRVYLADAQIEERSALRLMLLDLNLHIVGEAADWATTLAQAPATRPEIVLVDWDLVAKGSGAAHSANSAPDPGGASWQALAELRLACPAAIVIVLISHLDARQQELISMMVDAGFTAVFVGIETPDDDSLAECSKHQNRGRDLVGSVRRMQRAGMQVQGGFIVGFDSDVPSIFQRQIEFIQQSGIVSAMVGLLQAFPGTRLYHRLADEGRLISKLSGDNVDGSTNIMPKMDIDVLRNEYKNILHQIYSPWLYYERITTFLRHYDPPKVRLHLDSQYLLAFWRSIYQLGIKGTERVHYWRLWLWTLFHKPRLFPQAIELAIYGYHFRRVCELHS